MSISQTWRALLESLSIKHVKNVTRANHSAQLAGQKLKDCIYKQKMDTHIYNLSSCIWLDFALLRAFAFFSHPTSDQVFKRQISFRSSRTGKIKTDSENINQTHTLRISVYIFSVCPHDPRQQKHNPESCTYRRFPETVNSRSF